MSISEALPGAYVEEAFDDQGKRLPIRRRGYVAKVNYPNGDTYDASCVESVLVKFEADKPPEPSKLARLNLIRRADDSSYKALKSQLSNDRAEALGAGSVDKTGIVLNRNQKMPVEIAKKFLK